MRSIFLAIIALLFASGCVSSGQYNACQKSNSSLVKRLTAAKAEVKNLKPTPEQVEMIRRGKEETSMVIAKAEEWAGLLEDAILSNTGGKAVVTIHSVGFAGDFNGAIVGLIVQSKVVNTGAFLIMTKDQYGEWTGLTLHFVIPSPPRDLQDTVKSGELKSDKYKL